jgi:hypothetical protein
MLTFLLHRFIFILFLTIPLLAYSQEKEVVTFKDLGFQFSIPQEWEGVETESAYLLSSQNEQGFVTISTLPFTDIVELKKQLSSGIKKGEGFFLAPIDQTETPNENRLQGTFSGLINFYPVIAYIIVIKGEHQQMVMIIAADSKESYSNKYEVLANEIAASFSFFKPQMPSMIDEYKDILNDTRLTFVESEELSDPSENIGHRAKTTIDLCSKGYFNFYNFRSGGMTSAFSDNNNKGAGLWDIIKNNEGKIILQLQYYDDEIANYILNFLEKNNIK